LSSDETASWQRKIDHRLRALWTRTPDLDRAQRRIRVLVRFTQSADLLTNLGVKVHSVAADIASGSIMLTDLPRIASAEEVAFIEFAQAFATDS